MSAAVGGTGHRAQGAKSLRSLVCFGPALLLVNNLFNLVALQARVKKVMVKSMQDSPSPSDCWQ